MRKKFEASQKFCAVEKIAIFLVIFEFYKLCFKNNLKSLNVLKIC